MPACFCLLSYSLDLYSLLAISDVAFMLAGFLAPWPARSTPTRTSPHGRPPCTLQLRRHLLLAAMAHTRAVSAARRAAREKRCEGGRGRGRGDDNRA